MMHSLLFWFEAIKVLQNRARIDVEKIFFSNYLKGITTSFQNACLSPITGTVQE